MTIIHSTRCHIQAPLTYPIGPSDGGDTIPVAADITYTCRPLDPENPHLEVLDVTPLEERFGGAPYDADLLMDRAQEWLYGDGYDLALRRAQERRGER